MLLSNSQSKYFKSMGREFLHETIQDHKAVCLTFPKASTGADWHLATHKSKNESSHSCISLSFGFHRFRDLVTANGNPFPNRIISNTWLLKCLWMNAHIHNFGFRRFCDLVTANGNPFSKRIISNTWLLKYLWMNPLIYVSPLILGSVGSVTW